MIHGILKILFIAASVVVAGRTAHDAIKGTLNEYTYTKSEYRQIQMNKKYQKALRIKKFKDRRLDKRTKLSDN